MARLIVLLVSNVLLAGVALPTDNSIGPRNCQTVTFNGDVVAGQPFSREIGAGLVLNLLPQSFVDAATDPAKELTGWRIELQPIHPAGKLKASDDFIYPANTPLRFNPRQDIGTSYGTPADEKLAHTIKYAFITNQSDYLRVMAAVEGALWPYSSKNPDGADANYLDTLSKIDLGEIRFSPTRFQTADGGKSIRSLQFRVRVVAPPAFIFAKSLTPRATDCPRQTN